jgi:hypothetical protein
MPREGKMDVLIAVIAVAVAGSFVIVVEIVVRRRPVNGLRSDSFVQTLARAYRNSWRHSHKL